MTKYQLLGVSFAVAFAAISSSGAENEKKVEVWGRNTPDWTVDVPQWQPVAAGEHPRLVFRRADIPKLKARATTPEGKVIIARLEKLLEGPFTLNHPVGCGLLFVLTGDKQYADKAREYCTDIIDKRKSDKDGRYGFYNPGSGGPMRSGPAIAAMGLAYDLNYDGWDDAFRQKVALAIQNNPFTSSISAHGPIGPGCNHYGAAVGGVGSGLLAIRGDAGTDPKKVADLLAKIVQQARDEIAIGYGDRGYYFEGTHCGRISSNTGLIPFLQHYRVSAGKDLVSRSENARWLTAKWIYEFAANGDGTYVNAQRGMYSRNFTRTYWSESSDFCQGFGICPPEFVPALKWVYNRQVEPGQEKTFDILQSPHQAVYALANWPFDVPEKNPQDLPKLLPRVLHDKGAGYFVFRNGWSGDGQDICVSVTIGASPTKASGRGMAAGSSPLVYGKGLPSPGYLGSPHRAPGYMMPVGFHSSYVTYTQFEPDGSGVIACRKYADVPAPPMPDKNVTVDFSQPSSLAVDFSGASGAELLCAGIGPLAGYEIGYWQNVAPGKVADVTGANGYATKTTAVTFGEGRKGYVVTLQKGAPPAVTEQAGQVRVGNRLVTFDGEKLVLGKP
jgi:hypothetical protein